MIDNRFLSIFSVREVVLLGVPKVRPDVIRKSTGLNVDNLSHSKANDRESAGSEM